MNARERLAVLYAREERLRQAKWQPWTSGDRRLAIEKLQLRIWAEQRKVAPEAHLEAQVEEWPNGLPAHP